MKPHLINIKQEDVSALPFIYFQRNCSLSLQPSTHFISLNSNSFGAASKSARQTKKPRDDVNSSTGTASLLVICSISSRLYFQSQTTHVCGYKSFAETRHTNP